MPKTTTFNSKYGYTRHPDDKDHTCFWCGDEAKNTWDYTPCRDIAQFPDIMAKLGQAPVAVTACKSCIAVSLYRKMTHRTIDDKKSLFAAIREARELKRKRIMSQVSINPWQLRDNDTGTIYDVPDEMLDEGTREMKRRFLELNPPAPILGDWD